MVVLFEKDLLIVITFFSTYCDTDYLICAGASWILKHSDNYFKLFGFL